jgi:hypothetical protein
LPVQRHLQVVFALMCDARHLLSAAQVGAVADHAAMRLRQGLAARHARRIGRCGWWRRGHGRQRGNEL